MNEETIIKLIQDRGLEEAGNAFLPGKKNFFSKNPILFFVFLSNQV